VDWLQTIKRPPQLQRGSLPDYLGKLFANAPAIVKLSANLNRSGNSQHLVWVDVWLLKMKGVIDTRLGSSGGLLQSCNSCDAFFTYFVEGRRSFKMNETLVHWLKFG
jgi:hypothetical protein